MVSSLIQTSHSTQPFTHFVRKMVQNASNHAHTLSINQLQSQSKMDNQWTSNTHSAVYVCGLHIDVVLHPHSKQFWLSIWQNFTQTSSNQSWPHSSNSQKCVVLFSYAFCEHFWTIGVCVMRDQFNPHTTYTHKHHPHPSVSIQFWFTCVDHAQKKKHTQLVIME